MGTYHKVGVGELGNYRLLYLSFVIITHILYVYYTGGPRDVNDFMCIFGLIGFSI